MFDDKDSLRFSEGLNKQGFGNEFVNVLINTDFYFKVKK